MSRRYDRGALALATDFLDSWIAYKCRNLDPCGLTVAIHCGDEIVMSRAYGHADLETGERLTTSHMMCAGSQSKMLASTAVCQLAAAGVLGLDERVCAYLPWVSSHGDSRFQEITLRQLLTHTSGMAREGNDAAHWQFEKPFPDDDGLRAAVLDSELALESNTQLKYSNLGFALLGQVIAAVSDTSYGQYVTEHIIQPLGMHATVPEYAPEIAPLVATSYGSRREGVVARVDCQVRAHAFAPVTGLHTTAEDMCRFAAGHYWREGLLLDAPMRKEAHRGQWVVTTGYDAGAQMGLGFQIMTAGDRRLVGHSGSFGGYVSATFFEPEHRLAVSIMSNYRDTPCVTVVRGVFEALHHFERYGSEAGDHERCNTRVRSILSTVEIIATKDRIVAINPGHWEPLTFAVDLTSVDPSTLRVSTPGSIFHEGELVRFDFDGETVKHVNYGGFTMEPFES